MALDGMKLSPQKNKSQFALLDGSDKKAGSEDEIQIQFAEEEEKKDDNLPLILDDLSSSEVCASCSELNQIDPDCEDEKEMGESIRKGVFTKWWTKIPPVDGHSHFENL